MTPSDRLAIVNARIRTGNPRRPWGEALLMLGDRIELVGSSAEVRKRIAIGTKVIDVRGMLLMPSWREADTHRDESELLDALYASVRGTLAIDVGVLDAGALANLVVLDRDITREKPGDVDRAQVLMSVEAGRVVVDRAGLA